MHFIHLYAQTNHATASNGIEWVTSSKLLVTSTQILVAFMTRMGQFRTLW